MDPNVIRANEYNKYNSVSSLNLLNNKPHPLPTFDNFPLAVCKQYHQTSAESFQIHSDV